jgi:hypothetical protein
MLDVAHIARYRVCGSGTPTTLIISAKNVLPVGTPTNVQKDGLYGAVTGPYAALPHPRVTLVAGRAAVRCPHSLTQNTAPFAFRWRKSIAAAIFKEMRSS